MLHRVEVLAQKHPCPLAQVPIQSQLAVVAPRVQQSALMGQMGLSLFFQQLHLLVAVAVLVIAVLALVGMVVQVVVVRVTVKLRLVAQEYLGRVMREVQQSLEAQTQTLLLVVEVVRGVLAQQAPMLVLEMVLMEVRVLHLQLLAHL
jgi:hypothetical protein